MSFITPICLLILLAAPASAQPSQQLRQELDQAQKQIESLTADRDSLAKQLTQAQKQVTTLQAQISQSPPPTQPKARIPTDPFAAPASMLAELRRRFDRQMRGQPLETGRDIAAYQRNVEKWCTTVPRSLRGKTTWLVRIEFLAASHRDEKRVRIQILDHALAQIGDPFNVPIPNRFADRIERAIDQDLWELTAFVVAEPKLDEDRPDPGIFNAPDFLGPYAQFDFTMEWVGLAPTQRTAEPTNRHSPKSRTPNHR